MSNNVNSPGPAPLPYYLASFKGRIATIKLIQKSILALGSLEPQNIIISTSFPDYGDVLAQVSEEIWPDIVGDVKTIEITLEEINGPGIETAPTNETTSVTFTPRGLKPEVDRTSETNSRQFSVTTSGPTSTPALNDPKGLSTDHTGPLSITLRTTSRDLIPLNDLPESVTVRDVKNNIEARHGIPEVLQDISISGEKLDDDLELKRSAAIKGEPVDLVLHTRKSKIYVLAAYNSPTYRYVPLQNVKLQLSLNRKWEISAFQATCDVLSDHIEHHSWTISLSDVSKLFDHDRESVLHWLQWDGSPSTRPSSTDLQISHDHSALLLHTVESYRSMLTLEFNNSVAVPFDHVENYIRGVFVSLKITRRELLSGLFLQLSSKACSYLAIRFLSQAEYRKAAKLSIPDQTNVQVIHVVLLYKSLDSERVPLWNEAPPHEDDSGAAWQNDIDPEGILKKNPWERYCPVVVDFTFLEIP
ncbi:ubiquitin family protein [Ceratobasidium sp. AG-Ba]|nr:ubiquitin family protein [Ceratobasidium sp. AG-Ba]